MDIIDALHKLGFSFWQLVVIGIIMMFRNEFRNLIQRIVSLKVSNNEIILSENQNIISDLNNIKEEIKRNPSTENAIELIEQKIQNRLLVALSNLKNETTYLWPTLLTSEAGEEISTGIREITFSKIENDLKILMQANLLSYKLDRPMAGVYEISIQIISPKLSDLIKLVEKEY